MIPFFWKKKAEPAVQPKHVKFYSLGPGDNGCDLANKKVCIPMDEAAQNDMLISVVNLFIGIAKDDEAMAFRFCPFCGADYLKWSGYLANAPAEAAAKIPNIDKNSLNH